MQTVYSLGRLGSNPNPFSVSRFLGLTNQRDMGAVLRRSNPYGEKDFWLDLENMGPAAGLGALGGVRSRFVVTRFGGTFVDARQLAALYFSGVRAMGAVFGPDPQNGNGTQVSFVDPNVCTDNGDGTFTCIQDGSTVTDCAQCPSPTGFAPPPQETVIFSGGTQVTTNPDGSTTIVNPDGSAQTSGPSESGGLTNPFPNQQVVTAGGGLPSAPGSGFLANGAFGLSRNELFFVSAAAAGFLGYAYLGKKKRRSRRRRRG